MQNVALANKHIHDVETGPSAMLELEPLEAEAEGSQTTAQAFVTAMAERHPLAAERYLLALLERGKPGEILDLILSVALPRAALDEHHFNYPVFAAMALDDIGWEWADVILRPAVRYVAGHPPLYGAHGFPDHYVDELLRNYRDFATLERLIEEYRLLEIDPARRRRRARDRLDRRARRAHRRARQFPQDPAPSRRGAGRTVCRSKGPARRSRSVPQCWLYAGTSRARTRCTCTLRSMHGATCWDSTASA